MAIANTIRIDLDGQKDIQAGVSLSTGDTNAYELVLEFYKDGAFYDITGYNISIYARRSGATAPIPDVGTVQNGKGYYVIKPSMYAYAGETQIEIVLTDSMGMSFVSKVLHFNVRGGFSTTATVSETDYSVLVTLIQQAQAAVTNANSAADYANETVKLYEELTADGEIVKAITVETDDELDDLRDAGLYMITQTEDDLRSYILKVEDIDGTICQTRFGSESRTYQWELTGMDYGEYVWSDWHDGSLLWNTTREAGSWGIAGQTAFDDNYFYICTAPNTWIRFAKTAW